MNNLIPPNVFEEIVAFRRDMHQYPELSWQEHNTCKKICQKLDALGISHKVVAETGVVAEICPANVKGKPYVAIRADIDALPVQEETDLEFSSKVPGVMHACGHDGHTSIVLGAAALLRQEKELVAPIRFIFQPAEEKGNGAKKLVEEGVLENVAAIFGGHLDRHFKTGEIAVTPGSVNASTDSFFITIKGQGGHGARPHESIDAVVVGSLIVMSIQTIVSREVDPAYPSVISVGTFQAGTAPNVIAGTAKLEGTIRALHPEVQEHLHKAIIRIADSIGQLHGAQIETKIRKGTPSLTNSLDMVKLCEKAALNVIPKENLTKLHKANMGGEDFSYYLQKVPGCYVRFGSQIKGKESYPAHSSKFDFDENALAVGAKYFAEIAKIATKNL